MILITKTKNDENGWKITCNNENRKGIIKEKIEFSRGEIGTTIYLKNIFKNIPVRFSDLNSNLKHYYNKVKNIINEYSIISINTRIIFYHTELMKKKELIINSGINSSSILDKIERILGNKITENLEYFQCNNEEVKINGYILKNIISGSLKVNSWLQKNILYFYLNKRPINPVKKIVNILNEVYKEFNSNTKIIAILEIFIDNKKLDFNVSKDKREIIFQEEKKIMDFFKESLIEFHQKNKSMLKNIDNCLNKSVKKKRKFKEFSQDNQGNGDINCSYFIEGDKKILVNKNKNSIVDGIKKKLNKNSENSFNNVNKSINENLIEDYPLTPKFVVKEFLPQNLNITCQKSDKISLNLTKEMQTENKFEVLNVEKKFNKTNIFDSNINKG